MKNSFKGHLRQVATRIARSSAIGGLLLFSACGYTLTHRLQEPLRNPKGIYIPVFTNLTNETGAESIVTDAVIRELQSRGAPRIVSRQPGAYELRGTITSIGYAPTTYTAPGFKGLQPYQRIPSEVGITISLSLALVDPAASDRVLWSRSFSGFRRVATPINRTYDYDAPSSLGQLTLSLIYAEYALIAQNISRDVYDEMVELF